MSITNLAAVQDQVDKYISPILTKQLRSALLLGSVVDKTYEGAIAKGGDRVRVWQVNAPNGQMLDVGTDADSFTAETINKSYIDITASKRAVAAYEFADLVELQSRVNANDPAVMDSLVYALNKQINTFLYSLMVPSTSGPDHDVSGVTDFNASQLSNLRLLAASAKWGKDKPWYLLLSPSYYSDLLNATTMTDTAQGASDLPLIGGEFGIKRHGFMIFEDNSLGTDVGYALHPDAIHMVSQTQVQTKISDLHAVGRFGFKMSVDMVLGGAVGVDGAKKMIKVYNS